MKRGIVIALMLVLVGFGMRAQDDAETWRLRVPTAAEYLAAVPSLVELGNQEAASSTYSSYYSPMFFTLTTEIYARYPELWRADPEVIYEAYKSFRTGHDFWYDRDRWTHAIILAWIQQQHVDLSRTRYLRILDYQINVKGRDFNADGHDEWWLHIDSPDFTQDVVVAGEKGAYHIIDSPLPWFGCCFMYYDTQSGFMKEQLFGDINADGLPEWVMALGGIGANQTNGGVLYVLQWKDGKLIDLTPPDSDPNRIFYTSPAGGGYPPLFPYGIHVEYTDQNRDGIREIVIVQNQDDNWGCTWTLRRNYVWNGTGYRFDADERSYNAVQGCEIRWAEEAMWEGDYQTAIGHYERGLELPPTEEYFSGDHIELKRYAMARLALAYTLAGENAEAARVLRDLPLRSDDSPTLVQFIDAIKSHLGNTTAMCEAAYETFLFNCTPGTDACMGSPLNTVVGWTIENSGYGVNSPGQSFPVAADAGCNPAVPLQDELNANPLVSDKSPVSQLESRGLTILKSLHFDLNADGVEEWLVWLTEPVPALFFYAEPGDTHYQLSYTQLPFYLDNGLAYGMMKDQSNPYFDGNVEFTTRRMSDDNNRVLVSVLPREYDGYSYWCPFPDNNHRSNVQYSFAMWVLKNGQLEFNGEIPFCKMVNLENVFGDDGAMLPSEVDAWTYVSANQGTGSPATYTWDAEQAKYVITSVEPVPEEVPAYTTSFDAVLWDVQKAMANEKDYQKAIQILDQGLNNADLLDIQLKSLQYLRALALEALGRDDEALAEYGGIYEAAPESAWGLLAGLNLEPLP